MHITSSPSSSTTLLTSSLDLSIMAPHAITPESSPSEIGDFAAPDGASGKLPSTQSEPIAIIGMGCRLPGDSSSPGKLWNLLSRGDHGRRPIPEERFNVDGYYHPDSDRNGSMSTRGTFFSSLNLSFITESVLTLLNRGLCHQ